MNESEHISDLHDNKAPEKGDQLANFFVANSRRLKMSQPWGFLGPVRSIRALHDAREFLASMTRNFPDTNLHSASKLCAGRVFKVMNRGQGWHPYDVVNDQTRLSGNRLPAIDALDDYFTRERAKTRKFVFVASSIADLALLSQLQLPVVPAAGLSTITSTQARELLFPSTPSKDAVADSPDTPRRLAEANIKLILVGTDLFSMRNLYARNFLPIVNQIDRVERALNIDTSELIKVLLLTVADFQKLCDGVRLLDTHLVKRAILDAAGHSVGVKQFLRDTADSDSDDILSVRNKLRRAIGIQIKSPFGAQDLKARFEEFRQAYKNTQIDDCLTRAATAGGPTKKALWMLMAELLDMQFLASNDAIMAKSIIEKGRADDDQTLNERLELNARLASQIIAVSRAIAALDQESLS